MHSIRVNFANVAFIDYFWTSFTVYQRYVGVSALKIIEYRNNYMLVEVPLRDGPLTEPIFVQETKTAQYFRYQTAELNALCSFSETHQEESLKLEMDIYKKICEQVKPITMGSSLDDNACACNTGPGQGLRDTRSSHHHGTCGNHSRICTTRH